MQFLIGTSGWNYDDWRGVFYPEKWPKKHWLEYYAAQFLCIEINATFYRFFKDSVYHSWYERTPENFRFILKTPRVITHYPFSKRTENDIQQFWSSAILLKEKLDLVLLQLSPNMPYQPQLLKKILLSFNEPQKIAVEFRDLRWLTDEIKELLTQAGSTFCMTDSPKIKLVNWITSDFAYIRLHGHTQWYNYEYSQQELINISQFVKKIVELKIKKIFILFNNTMHAYAPHNALSLIQELPKILNNT